MKTIGFIDYYLYEFHANAYPGWVKEICGETGRSFTVARAWAEKAVSPVDGKTNADWTALTGVPVCDTLEEVCEKSDFLVLLSPDNPENHLRYAERVLSYGKPTYIDKTFAPDLATAKKIFVLSEKFGAPIFSTSALRCADELSGMPSDAKSVIATGGGSVLDRYIVHQLEMIVRLMGTDAKRVIALSEGENKTIAVDYGNGRSAAINYSAELPFTVCVERKGGGKPVYLPIQSFYFKNLVREILRFFDTGVPYVSEEQTLGLMAIRDACLAAQRSPYIFIDVEK